MYCRKTERQPGGVEPVKTIGRLASRRCSKVASGITPATTCRHSPLTFEDSSALEPSGGKKHYVTSSGHQASSVPSSASSISVRSSSKRGPTVEGRGHFVGANVGYLCRAASLGGASRRRNGRRLGMTFRIVTSFVLTVCLVAQWPKILGTGGCICLLFGILTLTFFSFPFSTFPLVRLFPLLDSATFHRAWQRLYPDLCQPSDNQIPEEGR